MNTNLKSSNLIPLNRQPESNSPNSLELTLVKSVKQLERKVLPQNEAVSKVYVEQAWVYFQDQNWQGAIAACKNALEANVQNADAYKILGNVLKVKGRKAEALGVYAKALALNPDSAPVYANLGSFYASQKDWQQALDYYQQAVILNPRFAGAYRSLAQIWEELGNTNQALECFCQAVNLEPETLSASEYFNFGKELYRQGKLKEASIFYTHGVKQNPQAEKELAELVNMLEELEEWQQAVVYYHQLISLSDDRVPRQDGLDSDKPIKNLLSRAKSNSQSKSSSSKKATQAKYPQRMITAQKSSQTSDNLDSLDNTVSSVDTVSSMENFQSISSKVKATMVQKSTANPPDSAVSWNNLGSLYAQKQQWTKAISCYQEAIQLNPNLAKIYRNLAKVYRKTGKELEATLCYYKSFTVEPAQIAPEQSFNLAQQLLKHQEVDKAIACLHRTVEQKPDFKPAYVLLAKIFASQGQPEAAQTCYQKIRELV